MKLIKFVKVMSMITVLALIYTHMQMKIFDLAYQGKKKEQKIVSLLENNGMVTYNILQLKSAKYLGANLLKKDSALKFRDYESVVQVPTEQVTDVEKPVETFASLAPKKLSEFFSFFSLKTQAEARQIKRTTALKPWQRRPVR